MSGRPSQRKGRAAELELCRILRVRGYPVEPGRARSFGEEPDLSGLPGIHIECKRCEALRLPEWMQQAQRDAQRFQDGAPAVFFRRSREPWMVCMALDDWLEIYTPPGPKKSKNGNHPESRGSIPVQKFCCFTRARPPYRDICNPLKRASKGRSMPPGPCDLNTPGPGAGRQDAPPPACSPRWPPGPCPPLPAPP